LQPRKRSTKIQKEKEFTDITDEQTHAYKNRNIKIVCWQEDRVTRDLEEIT
jgi:hypothetical protein